MVRKRRGFRGINRDDMRTYILDGITVENNRTNYYQNSDRTKQNLLTKRSSMFKTYEAELKELLDGNRLLNECSDFTQINDTASIVSFILTPEVAVATAKEVRNTPKEIFCIFKMLDGFSDTEQEDLLNTIKTDLAANKLEYNYMPHVRRMQIQKEKQFEVCASATSGEKE